MIDINELRQSAQAATPGPWYIGSGTYEGRNIYSTASVTDGEGFTYQPVVATAEDDEVACWDANARLIAAANPAGISELLDRLEAAEKERDAIAQQLVRSEVSKRGISEAHEVVTRRLSSLADENTALRAKIAEMEKQEPK